MSSLTEMTMECKKNVKIDFTGGELSSDGGLLLLKAFADKIPTCTWGMKMPVFSETDPYIGAILDFQKPSSKFSQLFRVDPTVD